MQAVAESEGATSKKRLAITAAAAERFVAQGYELANLDDIAERAGVSKQTIYNHFKDKEALFRAIIAELTNELTAPLHSASTKKDLRSILIDLGERCLEVSLRPSSLALHRLIISAALRFPDLGPNIYAAGAARMIDDLAKLIKQHTYAEDLQVGDPRSAAEQFFGMLTGFDHFRALLGVNRHHRTSYRRRATETADAFLKLLKRRK
jgi:TetR/AcrR family transcriptional regulator, mexJK operon transcriptional repressor